MKRIASWDSGKFMTGSSFLFSFPATYGYMYYNLIYSPLLLYGMSIVSANYWRDAMDDWRRQIDIYFARTSFAYFITSSLIYSPWKYNLFVGIPSLCGIVYCYDKSHEEYQYKGIHKNWVRYHVGFHVLITSQLFIIMNYMGKNKKLID